MAAAGGTIGKETGQRQKMYQVCMCKYCLIKEPVSGGNKLYLVACLRAFRRFSQALTSSEIRSRKIAGLTEK